jgi:hypothetical protein
MKNFGTKENNKLNKWKFGGWKSGKSPIIPSNEDDTESDTHMNKIFLLEFPSKGMNHRFQVIDVLSHLSLGETLA